MVCSRPRCAIRLTVFLFSVVAATLSAGAEESLKEDFESYFDELKEEFTKVAGSSVIRRPKLSPVDGYFVQVLKRHQPVHTLVRTNSKGVIINEVIRGEKPTRDYRGVSSQKWFADVSRSLEPYYGLVKEENGRYYLFWCQPIVVTSKQNTPKFNGAVAAKIDLWDIFHKLSSKYDGPFLVRLGKLSFYSHKWEKVTGASEEAIVVPGIDRISVRYVKASEPIAAAAAELPAKEAALQSDTVAMAGPVFGVAEKSSEKKSGFPFSLKVGKYRLFVFGLLLIIIPAGLLIRFAVWFKNWRLMRRIEREDEF